MSLYILRIKRPIEKDIVPWYFDSRADAEAAKTLSEQYGIYVDDNFADPDIETEFHEFESWWTEYRNMHMEPWPEKFTTCPQPHDASKTIRMSEANWKRWDAALRSGEYGQAREELADGQGNFCCLGVLQQELSGMTESGNEDQLPSLSWLNRHGIYFYAGGMCNDSETGRVPMLTLDGKKILASTANDEVEYDEDRDFSKHKYDFIAIADAIKDAVEFTDA